MRQSKTRAVLDQQLNKARIICKDIDRPRFDLGKHTLMEVLDLKRHAPMLPNTLTRRNGEQDILNCCGRLLDSRVKKPGRPA